jgi:hypothetical protein
LNVWCACNKAEKLERKKLETTLISRKGHLVGTDDQSSNEFVGQAVEVVPVEGGGRASTEIIFYDGLGQNLTQLTFKSGGGHTVLSDMLAHFGHGVAHVNIGVQQMVVLVRFPVREWRKLLRDGLEETNNNTNGSGLHIIAKFFSSSSILYPS